MPRVKAVVVTVKPSNRLAELRASRKVNSVSSPHTTTLGEKLPSAKGVCVGVAVDVALGV